MILTENNNQETEFQETKIGLIPVEWELSTVEKSFTICNSGRKPISEIERRKIQGIYPYYGPTKIQDYINEYQYDGKYALIAEDGDHFLKYSDRAMTQLAEGKFNVNNHAHAIQGGVDTITDWFYWFFYNRNIYSHLTRQGAGRYKLNKASLSQLLVAIPPIEEQQKIATILSTWDKAIEKQEQLIEAKEEQKKGLMQRLLTGKVRVSGFEEKWDPIKFKEIYKPKKVKARDRSYMALSVTKNGIVSQADYFKKKITSADTSPYLVVKKGDMVMSGLNFWMGAIDVLEDYEIGIVSPAYKVFQINNPSVDHLFMRYMVKSEIFLRALVGSSVQGASIVRRNLDREMLEEWFFKTPSLEEQKAIANILNTSEDEILLLKEKLDALREQKKGLMQRLLTGKIRVIV